MNRFEMEKKVIKWTPDSEPCTEVLLVFADDFGDFEVVREVFEGIIIIKLNAKEPEVINIAQLYLSLEYFGDLQHVESDVLGSNEYYILSRILSAFEAFKEFDSEKILGITRHLAHITDGKHRYDRMRFFLEIIGSVSTEMNGGFFHSIYGSLTQSCWWRDTPDFTSRLEALLKDIKKLPSPFKKQLLGGFEGLQVNLKFCGERNIEIKFMVMSAYCFYLSSHFLKKKLFFYALLLIHRALELYFTSIAISLGLIQVKRDFLLYYDQSPALVRDNERISLAKTYFEYVAKTQKLSPDLEDIIKKINRKRNSLLLTHGVDGISEIEIRDAYSDAKRVMKINLQWQQYLDKFKLSFDIQTSLIFRELLGIDHAIERIQ